MVITSPSIGQLLGVPAEPPQDASLLWPTFPGPGARFSILNQLWTISGIVTHYFPVVLCPGAVPAPSVLTAAVCRPLGFTLLEVTLTWALLGHALRSCLELFSEGLEYPPQGEDQHLLNTVCKASLWMPYVLINLTCTK